MAKKKAGPAEDKLTSRTLRVALAFSAPLRGVEDFVALSKWLAERQVGAGWIHSRHAAVKLLAFASLEGGRLHPPAITSALKVAVEAAWFVQLFHSQVIGCGGATFADPAANAAIALAHAVERDDELLILADPAAGGTWAIEEPVGRLAAGSHLADGEGYAGLAVKHYTLEVEREIDDTMSGGKVRKVVKAADLDKLAAVTKGLFK